MTLLDKYYALLKKNPKARKAVVIGIAIPVAVYIVVKSVCTGIAAGASETWYRLRSEFSTMVRIYKRELGPVQPPEKRTHIWGADFNDEI